MAKVKGPHAEMAHARQNDGISVIFDQNSPATPRTRSRSRSGSSRSSVSSRGRGSHRGRYRSSTSSSRSRSSSHPRSRSHPRCHRRSSCCRCDSHRRRGGGRYRRSPPRRHRARSHSHSCSPSPDRYARRRNYRSRSRSSVRQSRHGRVASQVGCGSSRSPSRTHRSRSKSRSSGRPVGLSLDDKRELLEAAKVNAMKILGMEKLELPKSVTPILSEQLESKWESEPKWESETETRVRQDPEKTPSQSDETESDDMPSPKMSPKRKSISFSINNSVAKPTAAALSCAKVTARVDIYESRKPYGHWVPVKSGRASHTRKHTLATLR